MTAFPTQVLETALRHGGSGFVYDIPTLQRQLAVLGALPADYLYPVKANPIPEFVACAIERGFGLDLCSRGDVALARAGGAKLERCNFTSAILPTDLAVELAALGISVDVDSPAQTRAWQAAGARDAGARVCTANAASVYGAKFGTTPERLGEVANALSNGGGQLVGLHLHDAHTNGTFAGMAERLIAVLDAVDDEIMAGCQYVNLGGGWPAGALDCDIIGEALEHVSARLARRQFSGRLIVEPGESVAGPCGWLFARIGAVKSHPLDAMRTVVALDVATPVPCRPTTGPFVVLRAGEILSTDGDELLADIYGSANTGLDSFALGVVQPALREGDVLVAANQGAYVRQLTSSFNERPLPDAIVLG